jgi:phosphoribosylaminoimidazole carboxylase (NCAIR synthetase)
MEDQDQDVGAWIILKLISETYDGKLWTQLAQDTNQWKVLVNAVMNLPVPKNLGKYFRGCTNKII